MTVFRIASLAAALVFTASVDLLAQQKPLVAPGARVRVMAPTIVPYRVVGTVLALDTSTLLLQTTGRQARPRLEIPLASLTRLELFRGPGNRAARAAAYALIGAGAGAVIGGLLGYALGEDCSEPELFDLCADRKDLAVAGAVILGGATAVFGLVAGLKTESGRGSWIAVPLDRIRVGLRPHGGHGLALTASVSF